MSAKTANHALLTLLASLLILDYMTFKILVR